MLRCCYWWQEPSEVAALHSAVPLFRALKVPKVHEVWKYLTFLKVLKIMQLLPLLEVRNFQNLENSQKFKHFQTFEDSAEQLEISGPATSVRSQVRPQHYIQQCPCAEHWKFRKFTKTGEF